MPPDPKPTKYRNRDLRLACSKIACVNCGIFGFSQAAHVGGVEMGKGMGTKVDDSSIAALCGAHPSPETNALVEGCHAKFDQHKLGPGLEALFVCRTYVALMEAGFLRVVL